MVNKSLKLILKPTLNESGTNDWIPYSYAAQPNNIFGSCCNGCGKM